MLTDNRTVENEAARRRCFGSLCNKARVVLIGDKADLHAVRLFGNGEIHFQRQIAHTLLGKAAEREKKSCRLLTFYAAEHIALVVLRMPLVYTALFGKSIMPGRNIFSALLVGIVT